MMPKIPESLPNQTQLNQQQDVKQAKVSNEKIQGSSVTHIKDKTKLPSPLNFDQMAKLSPKECSELAQRCVRSGDYSEETINTLKTFYNTIPDNESNQEYRQNIKTEIAKLHLSSLIDQTQKLLSRINDKIKYLLFADEVPSKEKLEQLAENIKSSNVTPDELQKIKKDLLKSLSHCFPLGFNELNRDEKLTWFYPLVIEILCEQSAEAGELVEINGYNALHFSAMLNDLNKTKQVLEIDNSPKSVNKLSEKGSTPLMYAVYHKNIPLIKLLLDNNADVNDRRTGDPPLCLAMRYGNPQAIRTLAEDSNIDLLNTNSKRRTALHLAVLHQDKYDQGIIEYLESRNEFQQARSTLEDIFGYSVDNLKKDPPIDINQTVIIDSKLAKYLEINNRDLNVLPPGGHCNGISFLCQYYTRQGKKEYYFDVLRTIAKWDGTPTTLSNSTETERLNKEYGMVKYDNLGDLMEQWINDIVWLHNQYDGIIGIFDMKDRSKQLDVVMPNSVETKITAIEDIPLLNGYDPIPFSRKSLTEKIEQYQNEPGSIIEFSILKAGDRDGHTTSAQILENGNIFYYDPNLESEVKEIGSAKEFVDILFDTLGKGFGFYGDSIEFIRFLSYKLDFSKPQDTKTL